MHRSPLLHVMLLGLLLVLSARSLAEEPPFKLSPELLDTSISLGQQFMLMNQKQEGNFEYMYNIETGIHQDGDSQVRQAGALWGLSLLNRNSPSQITKDAIQAGLAYFAVSSLQEAEKGRYIVYKDDRMGSLGTVSLIALAHLDLLGSSFPLTHTEERLYRQFLSQYFTFILNMRRPDGLFTAYYASADGTPLGKPSPYYDGESLLAMVKAARFLDNAVLRDLALQSADAMYDRWVTQALADDPDSAKTKGFYQWGSLAFFELYLSGWDDTEKYAKRTIDLAHWMIDTHRVLERPRNTAYAFEGIVVACDLARRTGDLASFTKFWRVTDEGLYKLMTWQVGGPVENEYLSKLKVRDPVAIGGVLNAKDEPLLRIDVTQHQMHALILARRLLYTPANTPTKKTSD